jgi:drug/metabolite transporter (DMT)-like permease
VSRPITLMIIGAVLISFSGVLVTIVQVPAIVSAFYRVFFGSIFLIAACIIRQEFQRRTLKSNFLAILCGLAFALDLWTWHHSILYVGPGLATLLANCQVFILTLFGFLVFKEKIGVKFIISLPMAFIGLIFIIDQDISQLAPQYQLGILLGLATAVFYSTFLLLLRKIQSDKQDFSLFYYLMLVSVSSSIFLGAQILFSEFSFNLWAFNIPDIKTLVALICLGLFIQTIAWVMISNSLPRIKASLAGLLLLLQPALSFVWDVLFFDRQTGLIGWLGLIIVLMAIYLGMSGNRKNRVEREK